MCDEQCLGGKREGPRAVLDVRPVHQVGVVADLEAVFPRARVLDQAHCRLGVVGAKRGALPNRDGEHFPPSSGVVGPRIFGAVAVRRQHHRLRDGFAVRIRLALLRDEEHGVRFVGVGQVAVRVVDDARRGIEHERFDAACFSREV